MGIRGITETDIRLRSPDATIRGGNTPTVAPAKKWSNAMPTVMGLLKFRSKTELLVFQRLVEEFGLSAIRRNVRVPLVSGMRDSLTPLYLTVDFAIIRDGKVVIWIDAKTKRKSRDWVRGKSLFEASWGKLWEWNGRCELPWHRII